MINLPRGVSSFITRPAGLLPTVLMSDYADEPFGYRIQRPIGRHDWLITYTIGGQGRYQLGEIAYLCQPGDVVLLKPGVEHDYGTTASGQRWRFYWAHFIPEWHWREWLNLSEAAPGLLVAPVENRLIGRRLETVFGRLIQDNRDGALFGELLSLNALEEVLILVAQQYRNGVTRPSDARIDEVLRQISQNFQTPLTVTALAESVALSPSRLAHLFKEQTGEPIMQTLLKIRLWQASRLLEFTPRPIGDIARKVGFQSAYYFSRQFKARYGLSPTAYRIKAHQSTDRVNVPE